ncbi:hypothetical protein K469DRAFT_545872 [Zopfia rhizophila CBS 207.26]|uniref:Uncharacterized protein n=1 Tax=Zopfia rhizophila CBS 207.26 TaxID=1314779 RepID=A0A6A6EW32_9PEZI|nr:hypothetical protein K469DRAFT_545872 [Zopfia rhizophila CBS 207.26]
MPARGKPTHQRSRESSFELGSPSHRPRYNKRTGRPIRNGAGQKQSLPGYVDSVVIEADEPIESCSEDEEGNPVQPRRPSKRKRTPSPTPPPLEPIIYDEGPDPASEDEANGIFHYNPSTKPITMQFNIPLGFHGPLILKLDSRLLATTEGQIYNVEGPRMRRRLEAASVQSQETTPEKDRVGFMTLAPELRNKVYRLLFVADREFNFGLPNNFCRSAAFLRTCKQIHEEGCSILYGENKFAFDRNRTTRAPFWDPVPKEIGYKDVRSFLKMIGPANLRLLREVKLILEDAMPASTSYLHSHEERRYLNDEHLIDCLRILRQAQLRKLTLSFLGRRALARTDIKFLGYLEQIQADEVDTTAYPRWYYANKIHSGLQGDLLNAMTRNPKLYTQNELWPTL